MQLFLRWNDHFIKVLFWIKIWNVENFKSVVLSKLNKVLLKYSFYSETAEPLGNDCVLASTEFHSVVDFPLPQIPKNNMVGEKENEASSSSSSSSDFSLSNNWVLLENKI